MTDGMINMKADNFGNNVLGEIYQYYSCGISGYLDSTSFRPTDDNMLKDQQENDGFKNLTVVHGHNDNNNIDTHNSTNDLSLETKEVDTVNTNNPNSKTSNVNSRTTSGVKPIMTVIVNANGNYDQKQKINAKQLFINPNE